MSPLLLVARVAGAVPISSTSIMKSHRQVEFYSSGIQMFNLGPLILQNCLLAVSVPTSLGYHISFNFIL